MSKKILMALWLLLLLFGCGGGNSTLPPLTEEAPLLTDARGDTAPVFPTSEIVCWGDSLTSGDYPTYLAARFAPQRKVSNFGIGGETSSQILDRVKGHDLDGAGLSWVSGSTVRLKTRRVVPVREIDESYRSMWGSYGVRIAEPAKVEFFNADGPIGSTTSQLKAAATVSGTRFAAPGHPFSDGEEVYHLGTQLPAGIYAGKAYFVRDSDPGGYSLAEFPNGAAVVFGNGQVTALGGFYYDWAYSGGDHAITALTHTDKDLSSAVLWMGANNINSPAQVKADIAAAYAHTKTLSRRVLILTCIGNDTVVTGTSAHNALTDVNNWILTQYPDNSVDIYSYLRSKYDPASPQDVSDYKNGIIPSSLRSDLVHLNAAGNRHVADRIYEFFVSHGW